MQAIHAGGGVVGDMTYKRKGGGFLRPLFRKVYEWLMV